MVTPGTHVGNSTDVRMPGRIHVGSTVEIIANDNDNTVRRLQLCADYGSYRGSPETGGFKRYYKVAQRQRRIFDDQWVDTSVEAYSDAITYINWPVIGAGASEVANGTMTVKWYIQFRNPKLTNVEA